MATVGVLLILLPVAWTCSPQKAGDLFNNKVLCFKILLVPCCAVDVTVIGPLSYVVYSNLIKTITELCCIE